MRGESTGQNKNQPSHTESLADMPSFSEHMAERHHAKTFDEASRDGTFPEGIRDEHDHREFLEELKARMKEHYNTIVSEYHQLSAVDKGSFDFKRGGDGPAQLIELYAKIDNQTSLDEAKKELHKINKAAAINKQIQKQRLEGRYYSKEEKQAFSAEIVAYFRNNESQFNLLNRELDGQDKFPDGRGINGNPYINDAAELFWNLQNDTLSVDAWTFFCENDCNKSPEMEEYINELKEKRQQQKQQQQSAEQWTRRLERPDIFFNPNPEDMLSRIRPFIRRIIEDLKQGTLLLPRENYRDCNKSVVTYLSEVFELNECPSIYYAEAPAGYNTLGSYNRNYNRVTFYCVEGRADVATMDDIDTIAHEMWHAHQYSVADEEDQDAPSVELYKKNFRDYIRSEEYYDGYRRQLVEQEAEQFAQVFRDALMVFGSDEIQALLKERT